jgi:HTH-type transcriptional regulator, competence development regulator
MCQADTGGMIDVRLYVTYPDNMQHMSPALADQTLGDHVRQLRELRLAAGDKAFSVRQLAGRLGVSPAYVSRFERGEVPPPGERVLVNLALELGQDPDLMLAMAGKISSDLTAAILARPVLLADLIRTAREMPDSALLRIAGEARDGIWSNATQNAEAGTG